MRFVTEQGGQSVNGIMLIAESQVSDENFPNLHRVFCPVSAEIDALNRNGALDDNMNDNVYQYFVGVFIFPYHTTGILGRLLGFRAHCETHQKHNGRFP